MPEFFAENISELPYDPADAASILAWAETLSGKTLRDVAGQMKIQDTLAKDKGGFGKNLEIIAFRYKPNSEPGPDLPDAGVEIKSLPVVPSKKLKVDPSGFKPKERLQLHNINYMDLLSESWETCSLRSKCALMLIVTDEYKKNTSSLDLIIKDAFLLEFPIERDEPTIKADWEYVYRMVAEGKAHKLSSSSTTYLDVPPHGQGKGRDGTKQPCSDTPAKRRGFALKRSYIRTVYAERSGSDYCPIPRESSEASLTVEELVERRYKPFIGLTKAQIADKLGMPLSTAKNNLELLNNAILGLSRNQVAEEYGKAGYLLKSPNFEPTGNLTESLPFPYIRLEELLTEEDWDESLFRSQISSRMCLTIWQKTVSKHRWKSSGGVGPVPSVLRGVAFIGIPDDVVDTAGREVWEKTRDAFAASDITAIPGSSFNHMFHTRPHSTKHQPKMVLPDGTETYKQCFWINNTYMRDLLLESPYSNLLEITDKALIEKYRS